MKLDLSALPPNQLAALTAIADEISESLVRASRAIVYNRAAKSNISAASHAVTRLMTAIGRAQRTQQKGTQ